MNAPADESESLSRKLAVVSALRIAFVTVSLAASFALADKDNPNFEAGQFTLISVAYVVSLLYALALRFRISLTGLAYAQVVVDSLLVTVLVTTTGGIESVFTAAYVFVVIGAAITLFRRGAVIAAAACLLLLGTIALLQVDGGFGAMTRTEPNRAALTIFTSVISLSLVAALATTLSETARTTGLMLAEREGDFSRLQALHAAILRSLPAGLMTLDTDGRVRFVNEAACAILHLDEEEVLDMPIVQVMPIMAKAFNRITDGQRVLNPRERYEGPYARPDSTEARIGFSFAPLEEPQGSIVVFQDLTDIVKLKEAFERADRLATVGKLAAGLAHEVRNPLSSMCASIDVLKVALDPPQPMRRLMDNVVREGERLNNLITDFLGFARPRELMRREIDLSVLCEELVDLWRHDAELGRCEIVLDAAPDVRAMVDPDLLRQVLWNLARNAAQAMLPRAADRAEGASIGRITISTRGSPPIAEVTVTDDGPGVAPDLLKRIFDPFFTTKDRGTGLGLAIVQAIVEVHGGAILASSTLGHGTEMVVRMPTKMGVSSDATMVTGDMVAPESLSPAISIDTSRG